MVSRGTAATGTGDPLVLVERSECHSRPLMKFVEEISLNNALVNHDEAWEGR